MLLLSFSLVVLRISSKVTAFPSTQSSTDSELTTPESCPCLKNETMPSFQAPTQTTTTTTTTTGFPLSFNMENMHTALLHGTPCVCNVGFRSTPVRDDYHYTPGIGAHKLHTRAVLWNEARKMCIDEGGHLAIVNSLAESYVLMELFNRSGPIKGASYEDVAFLGIHDLYKEGEWVTIYDESIFKTGYTRWSDKWGGQPDNGGGKQHCGVFLKEGGLDDVSCDVPFAYFCEVPHIQFPH